MILGALLAILCAARPAAAQDWFKTGTGLGVAKARVGRARIRRGQIATAQPLSKTFHNVLWNDLRIQRNYRSSQPEFLSDAECQAQPGELHPTDWSVAPANAIHAGVRQPRRATATTSQHPAYLSDVRNPRRHRWRNAKDLSRSGHRCGRPQARASVCRRDHRAAERRAAGNRAARRLRSSASAAATRRSGPWITTAQISTS